MVEYKHLGIWLTPSLCWSKQIHEICMRANSKLAGRRSVHYLSRSTLNLLCKRLETTPAPITLINLLLLLLLKIKSVMDYGLCIYYYSLKQSDIYKLNQLHYRAGKLIAEALHFTRRGLFTNYVSGQRGGGGGVGKMRTRTKKGGGGGGEKALGAWPIGGEIFFFLRLPLVIFM